MSAETWRPFGVDEREFDDAPATNGTRIVNLSLRHPRGEGTATDRAATWLRAAMGALGVAGRGRGCRLVRGPVPDGVRGQGCGADRRARGGHP